MTEKPDGSKKVGLAPPGLVWRLSVSFGKVRAVDHFSWSAFGEHKDGSVNGYVNPCEKMKNETIDKFTQVRSCVSWALGGVGWPLR